MTRRERPPAVTRHLNSLLWLPAVLAALFGWYFVSEDLPASRPERLDRDTEVAATGTVLRRKPGGAVEVRYDNPVTEQIVTAEVYPYDGDLVPEPGARVALIVRRDDPLDVYVEGDAAPLYPGLIGYGAGLFAAALPVLMRRYAQRRNEHLVAAPVASFSMAGVLTPHPRRRFRCDLSLYPLDAAAAAPPLCTVPVHITAGARIVTQVFPVEVKGSPRPLGRVVARAGDTVLWPAGRAGRRADHPRPIGAVRLAAPLGEAPAEGRARPPGLLTMAPAEAGLLGMAVGVLAIVGAVTAVNGSQAADVLATGTAVVGEVVGHESGDTMVVLRYRRDGTDHTTKAPADFASDYRKGVRYPVRLDPDDPARARLPAEPYDAAEPVVWALLPVAVLGERVLSHWRSWRRNRAVAVQGPWRQAWSRAGPGADDLLVCDEQGEVVCGVIARGNTYRSSVAVPVVAAGALEPGAPVAVWSADGQPLRIAHPATNGGASGGSGWSWARRRPKPG